MRSFVVGCLIALGSAALAGGPNAAVKAAKTAHGRNGAVELELALLRDKIKIGDSLFVRTHLKNRSKRPMRVVEWVFRGSSDLGREWSNNCDVRVGAFVEIQDSQGHTIKPGIYISQYDVSPIGMETSTPDAETLKLVEDLKSKGRSDSQINEQLREKAVLRERKDRDAKYPSVMLKRGQSKASVQWCSGRPNAQGKTMSCPGDGYVELPFFTFERPGRYRIRAVWDYRPPDAARDSADEWSVLAATEWAPFEVSQ
jgi:hypothetical protein